MTNPNLTILLRIATPKSSEFFRCIKCASSGGITKLKAHRLCAFAPSSIVPRNFCSSAQSSHKLNPHGKLYNRPIAVRAPLAGIQQDPRLLLACRLENFGWEAWTRTRIARFRIWSPANWTTSHQLVRDDLAVTSGSGLAFATLKERDQQKRTAASSRIRDSHDSHYLE